MITLTAQRHRERIAGAEVIERDRIGPKVLLLPDGTLAKLFRRRRGLSTDRLYPYSLRFVRNARRLQRQGVATLTARERYRVPAERLDVVVYQPLPGQSLKQICLEQPGRFDAAMAASLGAFIAELHRAGIFFRSLHLGNILALEAGGFGLIDVADMRFQTWPLTRGQRVRNFRHLVRMKAGKEPVQARADALLAGYLGEGSHPSRRLRRQLDDLLARW
jgi:tRNA A-37 threonylcarbamoyl transferase component Bud32